MSEVIDTQFNPFALAPPDEATELRALGNALQLAEGFTLLFARCNQPEQRRRLVAVLRERLPHLKIQEIEFNEPITHLLDQLRSHIEEPTPEAVFVYGLENSLPVAAQAANTPLVANLNASRNSFSRYVSCPLVLWIPEYVLTAIFHGAPDFFSVHSGVYFFSIHLDEFSKILEPLVANDQKTVDNLPVSEKQERLVNIERLLQDYKLLSSGQRDYNTEARLLDQLGHIYGSIGSWEDAERCYIEARQIAQTIGNLKGEATMLLNLGSLYAMQGQWSLAEDCYTRSFDIKQKMGNVVEQAKVLANIGSLYYVQKRFSEAVGMYNQSLDMLRPFGIGVIGWQSYNNIGNAYIAQEQWQEALSSYQQSLQVAHQMKDVHGEAIVLSNIAGIYFGLEQWRQAEDYCQQALMIVRTTGDIRQEARILDNLGQICQFQGKWNEAVTYFDSSLNIRHRLGDLVAEGHTLHSIALLYMEKGDYDKALEFAQKAASVLQNSEDKNEYASVLNTRAEVEKLAHKSEAI